MLKDLKNQTKLAKKHLLKDQPHNLGPIFRDYCAVLASTADIKNIPNGSAQLVKETLASLYDALTELRYYTNN